MTDVRTTPARLQHWAEKHPDREAFVFLSGQGIRTALTSQEIFEAAKEFGQYLLNLGVEPGSVVCSLLLESPESIVAFFGTHFAGCILQNGTIHISDGKFLLQNLNKSKCRVVILPSNTDHPGNKIINPLLDQTNGHRVSSSILPHLQYIIYDTAVSPGFKYGFKWETGMASRGIDVSNVVQQEDGDALIIISSGTTGVSKLILYAHSNLFKIAETCFADSFPLETGDKIFDPHPMNWGWGLPSWYLVTGHTRVLIDQRDPPVESNLHIFIRDAIIQENCRFAKLSVPISFRIAEYNMSGNLSGGLNKWPLKKIYLGGQPMKRNIINIIGPLTEKVYNVYGVSETGVVSVKIIDRESKFEDFNAGFLVDGVDVVIVDENMKPCPANTYGQILVKSHGLLKEYVGDPSLTKSSFTEDGFFKSNDFGCLTSTGEVVVTGRYGDLIMRGESYFHPSWVEDVIRECPGVTDVCVVKVPDEVLLYECCACCVPAKDSNLTDKDVENYCKETFVNHNSDDKTAYPKYYLILKSLPLNMNGKLDRRACEGMAAERHC